MSTLPPSAAPQVWGREVQGGLGPALSAPARCNCRQPAMDLGSTHNLLCMKNLSSSFYLLALSEWRSASWKGPRKTVSAEHWTLPPSVQQHWEGCSHGHGNAWHKVTNQPGSQGPLRTQSVQPRVPAEPTCPALQPRLLPDAPIIDPKLCRL